jgi:tetratricopeptide (TPR) repeat protein
MQLPDILKTATLAVVLLAFVAPIARAQDVDLSNDMAKKLAGSKKQEKAVPLFPSATRSEPGQGISTTDMNNEITKLLALVNTGKNSDEAIAIGQKLAANHDATHYDRAVADQAIGYAYLTKGDKVNGIAFLQKAIELNALSNNEHYTVMLQVAKSQIAAGQPEAGLATLDRVIAETRQDKPEYSGIRGRVAYAKKDYAGAAAALQKSIDGSAQPDPNEQQMLLMSYVELKQPERAEKIAEGIAHAHPEDKVAIMNLAAIYQQSGKSDKAAAQLEDARKRGLFTEANDYRRLYALYSNIKGRESDSAAVISEGLQKGILQPGSEVYLVLGDDYYFTNQIPQAIDAYKKADAVSTDGEAALKLAKVYNNQGQAAEAKAAAERALQKGVKQPADAHGIIDRAGTATKKPVKKK